MAGPSDTPPPDRSHIETRLLVVAEMLEKAVAEVRRAMAEVRADVQPEVDGRQYPSDDARRPDV